MLRSKVTANALLRKRSVKVFSAFLTFSVFCIISLKIMERNLEDKAKLMETKIYELKKKYGGGEKLKQLRAELDSVRRLENFWVSARWKNNLVLKLLIRLSQVATKKVEVEEIYISSSNPYSIDFSIVGRAERPYDAEKLASRLRKKRRWKKQSEVWDNFLISSELVSIRAEEGKTKFVIKGKVIRGD